MFFLRNFFYALHNNLVNTVAVHSFTSSTSFHCTSFLHVLCKFYHMLCLWKGSYALRCVHMYCGVFIYDYVFCFHSELCVFIFLSAVIVSGFIFDPRIFIVCAVFLCASKFVFSLFLSQQLKPYSVYLYLLIY